MISVCILQVVVNCLIGYCVRYEVLTTPKFDVISFAFIIVH
jgi:hypothetical protein